MTDPVLVEVLRGDIVESVHRGAVAVVDAAGKLVLELGNIDQTVFPRSAVKSIQALPLIETGAADRYGLTDRELALACASHLGEPDHVATAQTMLGKCGLGEEALECGVHWPTSHDATITLARSGAAPSQLHNNCSGKHSGFLTVCRHCGIENKGYIAAGHEFQEMVRETMQAVTGAEHSADNRGTDGCSIPTYSIPLRNLASGFARMTSGQGLGAQRAAAATRLMSACMANPFFVAGTKQADTNLMELGAGRIFTKGGAEGVHCGAIPELGLGIALKCGDGAGRAAEIAMTAVLAKLLAGNAELSSGLREMSHRTLKNWRGLQVAGLRPGAALN
ncbi:MAG TPA: asparaginase [Mesorhizobium sp.]